MNLFLEPQQAIVAEIKAEQALVAANRELIARFEKKIQATLARVWDGEEEARSAKAGAWRISSASLVRRNGRSWTKRRFKGAKFRRMLPRIPSAKTGRERVPLDLLHQLHPGSAGLLLAVFLKFL